MHSRESTQFRVPQWTLDKWQGVVDILATVMDVPAAVITYLDAPHVEVVTAARRKGNPYAPGTRVMVGTRYCSAVIQSRKPLKIVNAPDEPRWSRAPELELGLVAYLGYPVHWPDGEIFGTICVLDSKVNPWNELYEKLMQEFRDVLEIHLTLLRNLAEKEERNRSLQTALNEVKVLRGLLPICAHCKRIRDDGGYWRLLETYLKERTEADFSHSICPECVGKLYPDLVDG